MGERCHTHRPVFHSSSCRRGESRRRPGGSPGTGRKRAPHIRARRTRCRRRTRSSISFVSRASSGVIGAQPAATARIMGRCTAAAHQNVGENRSRICRDFGCRSTGTRTRSGRPGTDRTRRRAASRRRRDGPVTRPAYVEEKTLARLRSLSLLDGVDVNAVLRVDQRNTVPLASLNEYPCTLPMRQGRNTRSAGSVSWQPEQPAQRQQRRPAAQCPRACGYGGRTRLSPERESGDLGRPVQPQPRITAACAIRKGCPSGGVR